MPRRSLKITIPIHDILYPLISYRLSVSGSLFVWSYILLQECKNNDENNNNKYNNNPPPILQADQVYQHLL